jgi:hypothetical protein
MKEKILHRQICEYIRNQYPKILFNTDLSGIKLTMGQAKQIKNLRSNKGFPDLVIYEPKGGFAGLFLELKASSPYKKDGQLYKDEHLKNQHRVINILLGKGYLACFVWTFDFAKQVIDDYMNENTGIEIKK